jgi:hypothetical protein
MFPSRHTVCGSPVSREYRRNRHSKSNQRQKRNLTVLIIRVGMKGTRGEFQRYASERYQWRRTSHVSNEILK